jgi:hypothetical protein
MSNEFAVSAGCSSKAHPTEVDRGIRKEMKQVLQLFRHRAERTDRRTDRREPFPYPIYITPLDDDGMVQESETIVALGKHLSERGLDFYYQAPLPYRRVIASWECSNGQWLAMLLDLSWCRSNRHGWYENGGRFLQAVDSPMANRKSGAADRVQQPIGAIP